MSPFDGMPDYPDYDDVAALKMPPHSTEAEQAVIGGLLIATNAFDAITDLVAEADFFRIEHRTAFAAIAHLAEAGKPHDAVTVCDMLSATDQLDRAGGFAYLLDLAKNTPSAANIRAYACAVRERATLRNLITAGQAIADSGFSPDGRSAAELIDEAQAVVIALGDTGSAEQDLHCASRMKNLITEWERRAACDGLVGLSTGFSALDQRTNGLGAGNLIILAARPSMGKTSLVMNIAEHCAVTENKPALVFSMEMTAEELLDRMAAAVGKIPYELIRTGKVFGHPDHDSRIIPALGRIKSAPLYIDDRAGLTIAQMRSAARRVHRQSPLSLIVVDYLQLAVGKVRSKTDNREQEISGISRGLKALAKELKCPVIALSQLNRNVENRANKRPVNSDLRDSGAIEQDADVIWFIYRDEVYNEDSHDKGIAEILCTKQRNGALGVDRLATNLAHCRFENLSAGYQPREHEPAPRKQRGFSL
jgi:replicative DNA helicase